MAVAYDLDTQALQNVNVSSVTFSHTTSGTNRALVVFVVLIGVAQTVSSITYALTNLTLIGVRQHSGGATAGTIEAWGLANPATGANNVVVTLSANNSAWDASAISFTGAHQTTASAFTGFQHAGNANATATVSATVTTGTTGDMVVDCTESQAGNGTTSGTGQTQRWQDNSGSTNTQGSTKAGAASVTMTENWVPNQDANVLNIAALNVVQADTTGRTTKNTRAFPLGEFVGMARRMNIAA